jgi:hypothetical protein
MDEISIGNEWPRCPIDDEPVEPTDVEEESVYEEPDYQSLPGMPRIVDE